MATRSWRSCVVSEPSRLSRVAALALGFFAVALAGCGAGDPEAYLVGVWAGDMSAEANAIRAVQLKQSAPDADGSTVMAAARAMGQVAIEFRADKTCTVTLQLNSLPGTWKFDKQANVAELTLDPPPAPAEPEREKPVAEGEPAAAAAPQPAAPPAKLDWVAAYDPKNSKLALYQVDRSGYDTIMQMTKGKRAPGAMVLSKE